MSIEILSRAALLLIANIGCASTCQLHEPALRSDLQAVAQKFVQRTAFLQQLKENADPPVRLKIPRINVDAVIEPVGLTSTGVMDVPSNPDNVGWYDLGSKPGEKGSAVLAGHLDWYGGKTAVFQHLDKLRKGDVLSVETNKGKTLPFIVREIRTFQPNEYAPDLFQKNDGRYLNLVTCSGTWDAARKNYSERLVVFADAAVPGK
ncbi:MAG: class F sortase [Candidatus Peribacter sp.]|nr:class F sortase [Candidatus Peribacter sp.]